MKRDTRTCTIDVGTNSVNTLVAFLIPSTGGIHHGLVLRALALAGKAA